MNDFAINNENDLKVIAKYFHNRYNKEVPDRIWEVGLQMKSWNEVYDSARQKCKICRCCPLCNGLACRGETPGPGGKGSGSSFVRNVEMLEKVRIVMDTITDNEEVSTASDFFGLPVSLPVYAAPISGILQNYGAEMNDRDYTEAVVSGCVEAGTFAFTGDGKVDAMFKEPCEIVKQHGGKGIPTIKPWAQGHMDWRIALANASGCPAIASDIDASGLSNLRNSEVPVGFKTVEDLRSIIAQTKVPFILKGIMSVRGAKKAMEAGAQGIIVSNHGGRVLDGAQSGIEVLEEIVSAVQGKMKVFVDGGFRSGNDVFKALALGADGVLIGRPISQAAIGDGAQGVLTYLQKIQLELKETMALAGCKNIQDITRDMVVCEF